MGGAGCGVEGGILGGEGGHVLSGLVTEGLRARDRGSVRLQRNQVSHLELQRSRSAPGGEEEPSGRKSAQDSWRSRPKSRRTINKPKEYCFVFQASQK